MRLFAIGDIHGCSLALDRLLESINLRPTDKIITLGDYIDKGPDSQGVIDRLIQLYQKDQLIPLKGNHELELLNARETDYHKAKWFNFGGKETLASYGTENITDLSIIPPQHWHFIEEICLDSWQNEQLIFVHANLHPLVPLEDQPDYYLFWEKFNHPAPHLSGKTMICGHTSQKDGQPINLGHAICIDTHACGKGWLTCLEVHSGAMWQTNQQGQLKTAHIDEYRLKSESTMIEVY